MTHVAGRPRRGVAKAWLLPLLVLVAILGLTAIGLLSRSILIDFVAWWPVWLFFILATVLSRGRRWGRVRVSALVAVLWVIVLGVFLVGHLRGWDVMPSASNRLVGPTPDAASTVALSARVEGDLDVGSTSSGFLYTVDPVRRGGSVAAPEATEQIQGTSISVRLEEGLDPGLYTFAGWDMTLYEGPTWNLSLAGRIDADLTRLRLTGLQLEGEGSVTLGSAVSSIVINVSGSFVISVPEGVPVRVAGDAVVPSDWVENDQGHASPVEGDGWVISVAQSAVVTVVDR